MRRNWILLASAAALVGGLALNPPAAIAAGSDDPFKKTDATQEDGDWKAARSAIAAKNYDAAIPFLKKVVGKNPNHADAYNYLGYTHARNGQHQEALGYYKEALNLKPKHRGANEYLGELHLKMGDLPAAEARLQVLDDACTFGCAEYDMLKQAVADYKASGTFKSRKAL